MVRLAELEHHVVGDVDDRVDRAHAGGGQPLHEPARRRADRHVVEDPNSEAHAEGIVVDADARPIRSRDARLLEGRRRQRERYAEPGRQVACDASDAERVGPVALDVEIEQDVGRGAERVGQRGADGERAVEDHDPVGVIAELELGLGADHAVRPLAPELATTDLQSARHHGADGCQRHEIAHRHVERATADLQGIAVAGVDRDELDPVGFGMGAEGEHLGNNDPVVARADRLDRLDDHAEVGHRLGEELGVTLDRGELPHP